MTTQSSHPRVWACSPCPQRIVFKAAAATHGPLPRQRGLGRLAASYTSPQLDTSSSSSPQPKQQQRQQRQCRQEGTHQQTPKHAGAPLAAAAAVAAAAALLAGAAPAEALQLAAEPSNALSLPTWAVHTSSVIEWVTAMSLMVAYAEATDDVTWRGMAWGMVPCLGSAMCACTWHFFYNAQQLEWLVSVQAALTVVGNFTCWWAAYRIYRAAQERQGA